MATVGARWTRLCNALTPREWSRIAGMAVFIVLLYVLGWGIFIVAIVPQHFKLLGIGVAITAYTLGLRHAFDADHIAAIDNTTRKLMSEGKRPLSVGFWFSLGHSTVVFVLGVGLTFAARAIIGQVSNQNSRWRASAASSARSCRELPLPHRHPQPRRPRRHRQGLPGDATWPLQRRGAGAAFNARGLMFRFFGKLVRTIHSPWQMYPVGILFGLGFDTATEVALLAATAGAATAGLPWYAVLQPAHPLRRRHGDHGHAGRILHELRVRLGVLRPGAQGLLQHHHHRPLRRRGDASAPSRSSACSPPS